MKPKSGKSRKRRSVASGRSTAETEALMQIARLINEQLDVDRVCEGIVESVLTLLPLKSSAITLLEPDGRLRMIACGGEPLIGAGRGNMLSPGTGVTGQAVLQGAPFWSRDVRTEQRVTWPDDVRARLLARPQRALLAVPLRPRGRTIGALTVADRGTREFADDEIKLVQAFADHAAVAIDNAQLFAERARSEAELRRSERIYRLLTENMADVVTLFDLEMRQLYVSPSIGRLRGYTPEESIRQSLDERMTPASAAAMAAVLREEITIEASGQGDPHRFRTVEIELRHRDGSTVWVETTATFLRDDTGRPTGIIAVSRNIEDRKRTEAALRDTEARLQQAERIDAIGRLTGGIAHDFNNLLTIILGRTAAILDSAGPDAPGRGDIELIENTAERAAQLTKRLLAFSRKQVLHPQALDLNAVVTGVTPMLQRLIGAEFSLITLLEPTLDKVHADRTQLEQIIVNLVVNARDAMPRGGHVTLQTASVHVGRDARRRPCRGDGRPARPAHSERYGRGHDGGGAGADLRAVFHHQGGRQGHRTRPGHRVRHRAAARRFHRRRQRPRSGHAGADLPQARAGGADSGALSALQGRARLCASVPSRSVS